MPSLSNDIVKHCQEIEDERISQTPHYSDLICPYCGTKHYLGECEFVRAQVKELRRIG